VAGPRVGRSSSSGQVRESLAGREISHGARAGKRSSSRQPLDIARRRRSCGYYALVHVGQPEATNDRGLARQVDLPHAAGRTRNGESATGRRDASAWRAGQSDASRRTEGLLATGLRPRLRTSTLDPRSVNNIEIPKSRRRATLAPIEAARHSFPSDQQRYLERNPSCLRVLSFPGRPFRSFLLSQSDRADPTSP
jgi:hypothetical protein